MKTKVISLTINDETSYLPLQENLDRNGFETFNELQKAWEDMRWGYSQKAMVELTEADIESPEKIVYCDEFYGVVLFESQAVVREWYDRPFDESPRTLYFTSYFASDCYHGMEYSKDFAYFDCACCGRTICQQNPSNGWMVQFKWMNECEMECNKCAEERLLENGIDLEKAIEKESLSEGLFMNSGDLEKAGWEMTEVQGSLVGQGRVGSSDGAQIWTKLRELYDEGKKAFIELESMSIGGMGGYVTIWTK